MTKIITMLMREKLEAMQRELNELLEVNEAAEEYPRLLEGAGFWQPVAEIDQIIFEMKCLVYPNDYAEEGQ